MKNIIMSKEKLRNWLKWNSTKGNARIEQCRLEYSLIDQNEVRMKMNRVE